MLYKAFIKLCHSIPNFIINILIQIDTFCACVHDSLESNSKFIEQNEQSSTSMTVDAMQS